LFIFLTFVAAKYVAEVDPQIESMSDTISSYVIFLLALMLTMTLYDDTMEQ